MTTYRPGDVILVPFPFTDLSTVKQRPALVLSSNRFNKNNNDVVVAGVTSHLMSKPSAYDYELNATEQRDAGLPKPSRVKLGKILTIDQAIIRKRLGCLSDDSRNAVIDRLKVVFDYAEV
jgi:mRNA interferase MazF